MYGLVFLLGIGPVGDMRLEILLCFWHWREPCAVSWYLRPTEENMILNWSWTLQFRKIGELDRNRIFDKTFLRINSLLVPKIVEIKLDSYR